MPKREAHCPACGKTYPGEAAWPRVCAGCGAVAERHPRPAVAVLLPICDSVLLIRHAGGPYAGQLSLPGGWLACGESWQQAAVRRLATESAVKAGRDEVTLYDVVSADDVLLVAGLVKARSSTGLPRFKPNQEVAELVLASSMLELAQPLHAQLLKRYLSSKQGQTQGLRRRRTSQAE